MQRGGELPPIELIQAYQTRLKDICENSTTVKNEDVTYGETRSSVIYSNDENRFLVTFDKITEDLVTVDKQREGLRKHSTLFSV